MVINQNIPGFTSESKLELLARQARNVSDYGCIVEVGSMNGRSSFALGANKSKTVNLFCYDAWHRDSNLPISVTHTNTLAHIFGDITQPFSYKMFKDNVKSIDNLYSDKINFPDSDFVFDEEVDLLFIDAGHDYETTKYFLDLWMPKMKTNGILMFDDYILEDFPGVVAAINEYIDANNCPMTVTQDVAIIYKVA